MKISRFIVSELLTITITVLCLALWCIFAVAADAGWFITLITAVFVLAVLAIWLTVKYIVVKKRTEQLDRVISELKEGYLLGETLPEPYDAVRWEYYTVMKRVSRSAIDAIERLKEGQKEYRDFIEKWIHEIKTPLTSCALIVANGGDERKLRAELKRADNLAESVLYFARLSTPHSDVKITNCSLRSTAESAVKDVMELLITAGISVEVNGEGNAATDHKAIAFSIRQLLVNCAKYCRGCRITITVSENRLEVEDNGCGIASHELPCIFNRGFVGRAGRKVGNGTGMGLYLVKQTCNNVGAEVEAQSEEGKFTRFIFTFGKG